MRASSALLLLCLALPAHAQPEPGHVTDPLPWPDLGPLSPEDAAVFRGTSGSSWWAAGSGRC